MSQETEKFALYCPRGYLTSEQGVWAPKSSNEGVLLFDSEEAALAHKATLGPDFRGLSVHRARTKR